MDLHPDLRDEPAPETRDKTNTLSPKSKLYLRVVSLCIVVALVIVAGVVFRLI